MVHLILAHVTTEAVVSSGHWRIGHYINSPVIFLLIYLSTIDSGARLLIVWVLHIAYYLGTSLPCHKHKLH